MNRTILPTPPDPTSFPSVAAWQTAVFLWMQKTKSQIEADSIANIQPVSPIILGAYTPLTTITGIDATSNFVATLVAGMQRKGLTSPVTGGGR